MIDSDDAAMLELALKTAGVQDSDSLSVKQKKIFEWLGRNIDFRPDVRKVNDYWSPAEFTKNPIVCISAPLWRELRLLKEIEEHLAVFMKRS